MQITSSMATVGTDYTNPAKTQDEISTSKTDDKNSQDINKLSDEELATVAKLQTVDTEVRAHEMAHQSAGGNLTGGANFSYQRGPDGKMYAVGGDVSITMPSGNDPEKLLKEAREVIAAAMAPSNPSAQDFSVATSAKAIEIKAQQEINADLNKEIQGKQNYQKSGESAQNETSGSFNISA